MQCAMVDDINRNCDENRTIYARRLAFNEAQGEAQVVPDSTWKKRAESWSLPPGLRQFQCVYL